MNKKLIIGLVVTLLILLVALVGAIIFILTRPMGVQDFWASQEQNLDTVKSAVSDVEDVSSIKGFLIDDYYEYLRAESMAGKQSFHDSYEQHQTKIAESISELDSVIAQVESEMINLDLSDSAQIERQRVLDDFSTIKQSVAQIPTQFAAIETEVGFYQFVYDYLDVNLLVFEPAKKITAHKQVLEIVNQAQQDTKQPTVTEDSVRLGFRKNLGILLANMKSISNKTIALNTIIKNNGYVLPTSLYNKATKLDNEIQKLTKTIKKNNDSTFDAYEKLDSTRTTLISDIFSSIDVITSSWDTKVQESKPEDNSGNTIVSPVAQLNSANDSVKKEDVAIILDATSLYIIDNSGSNPKLDDGSDLPTVTEETLFIDGAESQDLSNSLTEDYITSVPQGYKVGILEGGQIIVGVVLSDGTKFTRTR